MVNNFDIIVVGGGHAGVEAAYIASQFKNLNIAIITLPNIGLASAPCNPAIGGVGKGQVVRELDVLGGLIGKLADLAGIQYRTLNDSKGYAVQSTRVQIDKVKYSEYAEIEINKISNITVIRGKVNTLSKTNDLYKLHTESSEYTCKKLIMTVGTFLNGKLHIGSEQTIGGRYECESSSSLSDFFKEVKTTVQRFKTGTPARLDKNTIDYSVLDEQKSDYGVRNFHALHSYNTRNINQVSCYLARTNKETLDIIRSKKDESPMFNGQIGGVGARYCPSIEDKAYRYPDKNGHHIFIEPEGLDIDTVYPSGISTSLPKEVQQTFINSIQGLENAKILIYGYAVEYDVVDTTLLSYSLEHQGMPGLYFAGQLNGTSGYEEAAAQGYIAGINAALCLLDRSPFKIDRSDSYIGVMIEDLISNTRDEPYRLFTARNENRLYVREDNAVIRMASYRSQLGFCEDIDLYNNRFIKVFDNLYSIIECYFVSPGDELFELLDFKIKKRMALGEVLKQANIDPVDTLDKFCSYCHLNVPRETIRCLAISFKYFGYINNATVQNQKIEKLDGMNIDWESICLSHNVSFECKQRIKKIQPSTFGQLKIIDGIRPATLAVVAGKSL